MLLFIIRHSFKRYERTGKTGGTLTGPPVSLFGIRAIACKLLADSYPAK